jgi:hypothetical protein
MRRYINSSAGAYVFPIGKKDADRYKPATVTTVASINSNDFFDGEYFYGANLTPQVAGPDTFDPTLFGILKDEYWQIDRGNTSSGTGSTTAKITLPYQNPGNGYWRDASGSLIDPCWNCNVAVVKRNTTTGPGMWSFSNAATYNFSSGGTPPEYRFYQDDGDIISKTITESFSPFTLGYSFNTILILPVKLLAFDGRLSNGDGLLQWSVADDKDLRYFELEHSTDGVRFAKLATVSSAGTQYQHLHRKLSAGRHFYRLRVNEKSGNAWYSKVVMLVVGNSATYITGLQRTIVSNEVSAIIWSAQSQKAEAIITDVQGRIMDRYATTLAQGTNNWPMRINLSANGIYYLTVHTTDGVRQTIKFMKQQ